MSGFRNLVDLTVYIQSKLTESIVDSVVEDLDRQSAMDIRDVLVSKKLGLPFHRLRVSVGGYGYAFLYGIFHTLILYPSQPHVLGAVGPTQFFFFLKWMKANAP